MMYLKRKSNSYVSTTFYTIENDNNQTLCDGLINGFHDMGDLVRKFAFGSGEFQDNIMSNLKWKEEILYEFESFDDLKEKYIEYLI